MRGITGISQELKSKILQTNPKSGDINFVQLNVCKVLDNVDGAVVVVRDCDNDDIVDDVRCGCVVACKMRCK